MAIKFDIEDQGNRFENLGARIDSVDMENVKRRTIKRAAEALSEMVAQAVVADDNIKSPGQLNSKWGGGDDRHAGPSMSRRAAWRVYPSGDGYTVTPHPEVRQRAIVLNYGYPGGMEPTSKDNMRFTLNGLPIFTEHVSGPEASGYWQAAIRRFRNTDSIERFAEEEARRELETKL